MPFDDQQRTVENARELVRTAQDVVREAAERREPRRHQWMDLVAGRVCVACQMTQVYGEFSDGDPCCATT